MDFTEKRLAMSILVLAALTPTQREAETATATKVLAELHDHAAAGAEKSYAVAVIEAAQALGGGSEPWLAFTSRGPGKPPPALELLRPPPETPDAEWWAVFKAWIGPGQMYNLLVNGEMPDNGLNTATKTITLGVVNTAVAGAQALAGLSFSSLILVLGGGFGAYKLWKRNRKGSS